MRRNSRRSQRLWRLETIIASSLALLAVVTLTSFFLIQSLLEQVSEEDNANLSLIEEAIEQATLALTVQLPLITGLEEAHAQANRLHNEFELVVLDPDRSDDNLRTLHRQLINQLATLRPALDEMPNDLSYLLRENLGLLIDITEEVLDTEESNTRQQLFRDTEDPLLQIASAMTDLHQVLRQQSLILRSEMMETNQETQRALKTHQRSTSAISWLLLITLAGIILLTIAAQGGFFRLLYRRIGLLEQFANAISQGRFQRPPFSSNDRTGLLALRLAQTGRRIQRLLSKLRGEISSAQEARAVAEQLAFYDPLTGLENRRLFMERLHNALQMIERHPEDYLALLYLDLDNFKHVNDSLGHDAGDRLLKTVAKRLQQTLREEDSLARLGGDEFAMLVHCSDGFCAPLAQRILGVLHRPINLGERELQISTSIGIAIAGSDSCQPHTLLKNADLALYQAKEQGRNNYQFFSEALNSQARERMEILAALRQGIQHQQFQLFYQPKLCLKQNRIIGLEALIRWTHPELGAITPDRFIPVAEESGLITPLGEWILRNACQQAKHLEEIGKPLSMAINISARQFHDQNLANLVRQVLYETGLSPHLLELEITETMLIEDIEQSIQVLETLKREGVSIAIDDFGTGFSSMNYLKRLPLDVLKIDRAFLSKVTESRKDAAIAETLIELGHRLNLKVVAEGVETPEQQVFLLEKGCDIGQGMLFSRPRPIHELGIDPSLAPDPELAAHG